MIITKSTPVTTLEIFYPRYKDKTHDHKDWVALLAQYKVAQASDVIRVVFTKAQHLKGYEGYIRRSEAMKCPLDTNGKIPCYAVSMDKLERNEVPEIWATIEKLGW